MINSVNIIILNYNGCELLRECLPTIKQAAEASRYKCQVTLLDNGSTDQSIDFVTKHFPGISIYKSKANRFLVSYNQYIAEIPDDIIILLNNDIKLDKSFVDPLMDVFLQHPDAFMAGPKCWTFDMKQFEGSRTRIRFYYGYMQAFTRYPNYEKEMDDFGFSASVGSVVAFDRKKFIELEGFDDLYLPGRIEDLDLCYRGWRTGWKGYYQPKSLAFHKSSSAFNEFIGKKGAVIMSCRNTFLFTWKNISSPKLLLEHIFFVIPRIIYSIITLDFCLCIGFFQALPRLTAAIKRRKTAVRKFIRSDEQIFNIVGF